MILTDYTDNTKLELCEKPCKASNTKVYLNLNLRFQLQETGSADFRGTTASIESLTYYNQPSWVLRIQTKQNKYVLLLDQTNRDLLFTYLTGESENEIDTIN